MSPGTECTLSDASFSMCPIIALSCFSMHPFASVCIMYHALEYKLLALSLYYTVRFRIHPESHFIEQTVSTASYFRIQIISTISCFSMHPLSCIVHLSCFNIETISTVSYFSVQTISTIYPVSCYVYTNH